jgi:hypothetical protein
VPRYAALNSRAWSMWARRSRANTESRIMSGRASRKPHGLSAAATETASPTDASAASTSQTRLIALSCSRTETPAVNRSWAAELAK